MTRRSFTGGAAPTTLSVLLNNTALSASGTAFVGWPSGAGGNFCVTLDRGTATEEKVLAASVSGNTLTLVQRGYDGTTAQSHNIGCVVEHTISAVDLDEANAHVNVTTGVHGLTGGDGVLVGTTKVQTLTNKTLTTPILNGGSVNLTLPVGPDTLVGRATADTLTNKTLTSPTISTINNGGILTLPTGPEILVARQTAETLSNKTMTALTIVDGTITGTVAGGTVNPTVLKQAGVAVATTSGTETLVNKTLVNPVLTGPAATDLVATASGSGTKAIVAKAGTPAPTGHVFEVQDSAGVVHAYADYNGGAWVFSTDSLVVPVNGSNLLGGASVGGGTALGIGAVPLTVVGKAGQTAHLQDWKDSSGNVLSYVDKDGRIVNKIPSVSAVLNTGNIATSAGTELTLITLPSITGDGTTKVKVAVCGWTWIGSVVGDKFDIRIKNGATVLATARLTVNNTGNNDLFPSFFVVDTPAAGAQTYTLTVIRASGTGTFTASNAATTPISAVVEQFAG